MEGIVMRKIYLTLALVFALSLNLSAQNDGFFKNFDDDYYNRIDDPVDIGLYFPSGMLGSNQNEPGVPVGSGLLILAVLGVGYTIRKNNQ